MLTRYGYNAAVMRLVAAACFVAGCSSGGSTTPTKPPAASLSARFATAPHDPVLETQLRPLLSLAIKAPFKLECRSRVCRIEPAVSGAHSIGGFISRLNASPVTVGLILAAEVREPPEVWFIDVAALEPHLARLHALEQEQQVDVQGAHPTSTGKPAAPTATPTDGGHDAGSIIYDNVCDGAPLAPGCP